MRTTSGRSVSTRTTRRVWAAITSNPEATIRELMTQMRLGHGTIVSALDALRDAGYIEAPFRSARARRIIVPFCEARQ